MRAKGYSERVMAEGNVCKFMYDRRLNKNSVATLQASRSSNVRAEGNNHLRYNLLHHQFSLLQRQLTFVRAKAESKYCTQVCHFLNKVNRQSDHITMQGACLQ
jgi:hypothetical protein